MIVVTGASGLLGANFVRAAQSVYKDVVAVCHQHIFHMPGVQTVPTDLVDRNSVGRLFQHYLPRWVVHCAALTNVDWCEKHPEEAWRVNVEMSRALATAARHVGAGFVYISTDSVFDGKTGYYTERDIPSPVNVYGKSKLAGEKAVLEELGHSLIVRTNIYGWNLQKKLSLAEWVLDRLKSGQHVPGFYDVVFTPILANDLSKLILEMIESGLNGLYHVASSEVCTKYEFAIQVADVFGLKKESVQRRLIEESNLKAPRPRNTSLQTEKVRAAVGKAMPDVKTGLRRFRMLQDSGYVNKLKSSTGGLGCPD